MEISAKQFSPGSHCQHPTQLKMFCWFTTKCVCVGGNYSQSDWNIMCLGKQINSLIIILDCCQLVVPPCLLTLDDCLVLSSISIAVGSPIPIGSSWNLVWLSESTLYQKVILIRTFYWWPGLINSKILRFNTRNYATSLLQQDTVRYCSNYIWAGTTRGKDFQFPGGCWTWAIKWFF